MLGRLGIGEKFGSRRHERSTGWLGIDVGSSAIKVARVTRLRGAWSLEIQRLISIDSNQPLDVRRIADGQVGEILRERIPHAIRSIARRAACVLPMSVVELQTVSLPHGNAAELRQMISLELESREEVVEREFDYFENTGAAAGTAEAAPLTVLSVPTDAASGLAESLLKSGLACQTLETLPCVLGQAVSLIDARARQGAVVALDWGGSSPTLTLVSRGEPVFSRSLRKCGLQAFVRSAAAHFECSIPECYELLALCQGQSLLQDAPHSNLQQLMVQCAQPVLQQLQQELKKTLDYLKQEYPNTPPERLWLFGGGALIPGITERLQEMTGLDAQLWRLPKTSAAAEIDPWQAVFGTAATLSILGAPA